MFRNCCNRYWSRADAEHNRTWFLYEYMRKYMEKSNHSTPITPPLLELVLQQITVSDTNKDFKESISVFQTQPVPNPMSYYMHRSPWWFHRFETLSNHFIELIVPFFTFLGRRMCIVNGAMQILFQVIQTVRQWKTVGAFFWHEAKQREQINTADVLNTPL